MRRVFKTVLLIIVPLLIVGLSIATYFFYTRYQRAQKLVSNPQEISRLETADLVSRIGKLIQLPNETPTVATVQEVDKLKDQPFFVNAVNGDKVLIYSESRKAILYRPSQNKIIDITSLSLNDTNAPIPTEVITPMPTPMATATPTPTKAKPKPTVTKEATPSATPVAP
jgi:hypothetical protein